MFTLWYLYLGYEEYRRRGLFQWFQWFRQDNIIAIPPGPLKDTMESTTNQPASSGTVVSTSNEQKTPTNEKTSTPRSPTTVKPINEKRPASELTDVSDETNLVALKPKAEKNAKEDFISNEKLNVVNSKTGGDIFEDGDNVEGHSDEEEEEMDENTSALNVKDSKLLVANKESLDRKHAQSTEFSNTEMKTDKKGISFSGSNELRNESNQNAVEQNDNRNNDPVPPLLSNNSAQSAGRLLVEGSDVPMRCWLTEGDHPNHPAGIRMGVDNIKLISNRVRETADSILDSDEFLDNERHITRQISWPKKVMISDEPPTTFIRDIPPADNPETEPDTSPMAKMKREADLAAAAAAALKEDWRRKMEKREIELDEDENVIFGDSDETDDGQILQISDEEEASDNSILTSPLKTSKMVDAAVLEKLETGFKKLQASDSKSLLKKYLTQEVFDKLKNLKTPTFGSSLLDVIQSGLENHDSGVGIYAPDAEAYTTFADLFDPIIEDYHGGFKKTDKHPARDFGDVDTFTNLDPAGEYIISTRVRCGRSMEGYPFNPCLTEAQYKEMEDKVSSTLSGLSGELKGNFYPLTGMTKEVQQKLIDDHFLFKEGDRFLQAANACRFWPTGRGIYHNDDKTFLVWCNEEDHLRIISMQMGGDLGQVYRRLVSAVNDIEKRIPFSHNDRLGFLTFCPTNLGTTIRASVHIKVPKLAANRTKLEEIAGKFNLQVRGTRGEHTEAEGGVYDISNKRRMGLTEFQAVKEMNDGIAELIKIERNL